ncbi:MAG: helix-turn-helix transcriptional regulator [Bacteroidaceae bacterium]|nr:helix-turn-helix transcriptional regulator [Bacteroidaceae bacterium]
MSHREDIGSQIQMMRVQLGITKEELARMCGITPLNITKIENGVYNVPIDVVGKIADALQAKIMLTR